MSLDDFREAAILGRVIERCQDGKLFCGETLLQKSAYFLKEMFGAPISAPFRIYYYGPFSFDLRDRLASMEAIDVVRVEPHEWGATYKVGNRYDMLKRQFAQTLEKNEPAIDWVLLELAPLTVKQLEPIATALFLRRENPESLVDQLAEQLHTIKPHVSLEGAQAAITKVDGWLVRAAN